MRHPAIVKIVVPIPPVDGRAWSLVSFNLPSALTVAVATPVWVSVISLPSVLIEYPFGAFVSLKW